MAEVTTRVVNTVKDGVITGCFKLTAQILTDQGVVTVGLCGHEHPTPEAADKCPEAVANLQQQSFHQGNPEVDALTRSLDKWLHAYRAAGEQRRFVDVPYTGLERDALALMEAVKKLIRP